MENKTVQKAYRISPELYKEAEAVFEDMGMSVPQGITMFLKRVAAEKELPFLPKAVNLKEEAAAEAWLDDLQLSLKKGYQQVLDGETYPEDEVFAEFGL